MNIEARLAPIDAVEKLEETGYGSLPTATVGTYIAQWYPNAVARANFAQLASAYQRKHRVDARLLKCRPTACGSARASFQARSAKRNRKQLRCMRCPTREVRWSN